MSIEVSKLVWEESKQTGTALLMLLAIAEHADDDGVCWPSVDRLAKRCRVGKRQAQRLIQQLIADGELEADQTGGRGHASVYRVVLKGDIHDAKDDIYDILYDQERVTSVTEKGDIQGERVTSVTIKGDIAMSPDPSKNRHKEPSRNGHNLPDLTDDEQKEWEAVKDLSQRWLDTVGRAFPSDNDAGRDDYLIPAKLVLRRFEWDVGLALEALKKKRLDMLADGMTPYRLSAVAPQLLAELDARRAGHGEKEWWEDAISYEN